MKRILLLAMFAGLMASAGCFSQKVYKDGNKVILDLSVASGMPAGAVTNQSKYTGFRPSDNALGENNGISGSINATVFQKLEVAPNDLNTAGEMNNTGTLIMNWVTAFDGCKNSNYAGGDWRLPTQRELQLIYIFKPAIEQIFAEASISTVFSSMYYYWSSTEQNALNSWGVRLSDGYALNNPKANTSRVRCVREL